MAPVSGACVMGNRLQSGPISHTLKQSSAYWNICDFSNGPHNVLYHTVAQ